MEGFNSTVASDSVDCGRLSTASLSQAASSPSNEIVTNLTVSESPEEFMESNPMFEDKESRRNDCTRVNSGIVQLEDIYSYNEAEITDIDILDTIPMNSFRSIDASGNLSLVAGPKSDAPGLAVETEDSGNCQSASGSPLEEDAEFLTDSDPEEWEYLECDTEWTPLKSHTVDIEHNSPDKENISDVELKRHDLVCSRKPFAPLSPGARIVKLKKVEFIDDFITDNAQDSSGLQIFVSADGTGEPVATSTGSRRIRRNRRKDILAQRQAKYDARGLAAREAKNKDNITPVSEMPAMFCELGILGSQRSTDAYSLSATTADCVLS